MKCDEFVGRLNDLLDARASVEGDDSLAAHAAMCETCRQELVALGMVVSEIACRERPMPRAELATRVLAELRTVRVERRALRRGVAYAFAVAAALLVAAFPAWRWYRSDNAPAGGGMTASLDTRPSEEVVASTVDATDNGPNAAAQVADPPIGNLVREVGDSYKDLARETQKSYAELALLLPGVRAPRRNADAAPQEDVVAAEAVASRGWVNDMADGLKPVTDSTMGAFSFLLEALPTEVPAEKL